MANAKAKILDLLSTHSDHSFTEQDIVSLARVGLAAVKPALAVLVKEGLVSATLAGTYEKARPHFERPTGDTNREKMLALCHAHPDRAYSAQDFIDLLGVAAVTAPTQAGHLVRAGLLARPSPGRYQDLRGAAAASNESHPETPQPRGKKVRGKTSTSTKA
jgi:hypothetical protein